jgi:glutamyl-tRNA reductase
VVPTIAALRARGDEIVEHVLQENGPHWESLSQTDRDRMEAMARSIVSRLLHEPTLRMKRAAEDGRFYAQLQALRELFALGDDGDSPAAEPQRERRVPPPARVTSLDERRRSRKP